MTTPTPRLGTHWDGCEQEHHECALAKLAAREAELAVMIDNVRFARERAEAAERELENVKAENSKLRSALEIVHFKREPWQ